MIPLDMDFFIVDLTYTHIFPKPHSFNMHPCMISKKVLSTWKHLTTLTTSHGAQFDTHCDIIKDFETFFFKFPEDLTIFFRLAL